jgi:hypothetical protein
MITVAIHQPNYIPWMGYFYKIVNSDVFVFLDDVEISNSGRTYVRRAELMGPDNSKRWLTQPITVTQDRKIINSTLSNKDWADSHLNIINERYRKSSCFNNVFNDIISIYESVSKFSSLSEVNINLINLIADHLIITCDFYRLSDMEVYSHSDDRLIDIVKIFSKNGIYLSGAGGANYQNTEKFINAGLGIKYTNFNHPHYQQWSNNNFQPGLSILDPIFHLGWEKTSILLSLGMNDGKK